jgi:hypothetical protein
MFAGALPPRRAGPPGTPAPAPATPARLLRLVYEYTGRGALTLGSASTGRRYRFEHAGVRLEVDARDRALLDARTDLRQVR